MSHAARTSSGCCCVCPPQTCAGPCLEVPVDVVGTGSIEISQNTSLGYCPPDGDPPTITGTTSLSAIASSSVSGGFTYILDKFTDGLGNPDTRIHSARVNCNAPYSNGHLSGTVDVSGSASVTRVNTSSRIDDGSGGYYTSVTTTTLSSTLTSTSDASNILVQCPTTAFATWTKSVSQDPDSSFDCACEADLCRVLLHQAIDSGVMCSVVGTKTVRVVETPNGDSNHPPSDTTTITPISRFVFYPINLMLQFTGNLDDCENDFTGKFACSGYTAVGTQAQILKDMFENILGTDITMNVQDNCDNLTEQETRLTVSQGAESIQTGGFCVSSVIESNSRTATGLVTFTHNIDFDKVGNTPCP